MGNQAYSIDTFYWPWKGTFYRKFFHKSQLQNRQNEVFIWIKILLMLLINQRETPQEW
jgi:hypothetical protein